MFCICKESGKIHIQQRSVVASEEGGQGLKGELLLFTLNLQHCLELGNQFTINTHSEF